MNKNICIPVIAFLLFVKKRLVLLFLCLITICSYSFNYKHVDFFINTNSSDNLHDTDLINNINKHYYFSINDTLLKVNSFKNSFFVELLGSAGVWSLNYERMLIGKSKNGLNIRLGFGTLIDYPVFPILINYQLKFNKSISFETGLGYLLNGYNVIGDIGFRFVILKHFLIRTSFTPSIYHVSEEGVDFGRGRYYNKYFNTWGGISFGYSFGK